MGDKIILGVIGSGRIGRLHITNLVRQVPGVVVKTVADLAIDQAKAWTADLGISHLTTDYAEILEDPDIQAVVICSATNTHAQFSIESAQAGKDVFCEKPIDFDITRIHKVLETVQQAGTKYQIGFNRRYDRNCRRLHEVAQSGAIGDTHMVKITSRDPDYEIGYIRQSAQAGGIFYDMTIHDFDMARYVSGLEVEEVFASGSTLIDPEIGKAGDADTVMVHLKFTTGALGYIDNSRRAVYGYDQRVEVFGSKGMVKTENDRPSLVEIYSETSPMTDNIHHSFFERYQDAYIDEMKAFVDCIRRDVAPGVTGNDGLQAVLMAAAAKKSLEEHRPVTLAEVVAQHTAQALPTFD